MTSRPEHPGADKFKVIASEAEAHKPFPPRLKRLVDSQVSIMLDPPGDLTFQHSVFCQISLPYRANPNLRECERKNGNVHLLLEAGKAMDPKTHKFIPLPMPSGPKARLILCYLNTQAIRNQDPLIDIGATFTDFCKRLGYSNGHQFKAVKRELSALAAATMRFGTVTDDNRAITVKHDFIGAFDLWFPKDENQRILWPSTVRLSKEYFESLMKHAIPLDPRAINALSHNAMAIDIYTWLAQRLHRIPKGKTQLVPWTCLYEQFGQGYSILRNFRNRGFNTAFEAAMTQYPDARALRNTKGLYLQNSPAPIKTRLISFS